MEEPNYTKKANLAEKLKNRGTFKRNELSSISISILNATPVSRKIAMQKVSRRSVNPNTSDRVNTRVSFPPRLVQ